MFFSFFCKKIKKALKKSFEFLINLCGFKNICNDLTRILVEIHKKELLHKFSTKCLNKKNIIEIYSLNK